MTENLTIAVIGHVDHGKSTLIGRLLFDADQIKPEKIEEVKNTSTGDYLEYAHFLDNLEEERTEEMTIDVFYAQYRTPNCLYTFVDTPGHKELIKNMLSGASHAQGALVLISAAPGEGIQDQTRRHLRLAKLLGINQLIVVINKMDLVGYKKPVFEQIKKETERLLGEIGLKIKGIPFIPISAREGVNVSKKSRQTPWYQGRSLAQELDKNFKLPPRLRVFPLRLTVQDIYPITGRKILATRIETGSLTPGEEVIFQPSGVKAEVKEIKKGEKNLKKAQAGEAVGLILKETSKKIKSGQVGGTPNNPPFVCRKFAAQIYQTKEGEILKNTDISLRCGLVEEKAKIKGIFENVDGFARVQINTQRPLVIERNQDFPPLSRFVLYKNGKLIAFGIRTE